MKSYLKSDSIQDYGLNIIIRNYLCIPKWLPFMAFMEHGWTALDTPLKSDISAKGYPIMFVYSKRRLDAYKDKDHSFKKILISGIPFILYRKLNKIAQKKNAIGSIAFPSHGTDLVKSQYSIEQFCTELNKLPDRFKPITICLHFDNIFEKKIYSSLGFTVVTAGERYDSKFFINFYEIITSYKYVISNVIGSHTFYSVDLGIPFFIMGTLAVNKNPLSKDPNVPKKYILTDYKYGKEAYDIFNTGPVDYISEEQKKYVENESGIKEKSSRIVLVFYYWIFFFQWACIILVKKTVCSLFKFIKRAIKAITPYGVIVLRRRYLSRKNNKTT